MVLIVTKRRQVVVTTCVIAIRIEVLVTVDLFPFSFIITSFSDIQTVFY